jgi:methionine synthase II (cobalamin-independent)
MSQKQQPPFRADHVGSLLRPPELLDARARHQSGSMTDDQLREVEDHCIRTAVKLQEDVGLEAITDGEYRRTFFISIFWKNSTALPCMAESRSNSTATAAMSISRRRNWKSPVN